LTMAFATCDFCWFSQRRCYQRIAGVGVNNRLGAGNLRVWIASLYLERKIVGSRD